MSKCVILDKIYALAKLKLVIRRHRIPDGDGNSSNGVVFGFKTDIIKTAEVAGRLKPDGSGRRLITGRSPARGIWFDSIGLRTKESWQSPGFFVAK